MIEIYWLVQVLLLGFIFGLIFSFLKWIYPLIMERNDLLVEVRWLEDDLETVEHKELLRRIPK